MEVLIKPDRAAAILGITRGALMRLCAAGKVAHYRLNKTTYRFSESVLTEYLERSRVDVGDRGPRVRKAAVVIPPAKVVDVAKANRVTSKPDDSQVSLKSLRAELRAL